MRVDVANYRDRVLHRIGRRTAAAVRTAQLEGWVRPEGLRPVISEDLADALGLATLFTEIERCEEGCVVRRQVVGDLWLRLCGREGVFKAVVEPGRGDVLIGAIVLEDLDLLADPRARTCHPRDAAMTLYEIE